MTLLKIAFGKWIATMGAKPLISHHFFDKNGKELDQTIENLKDHTFVGTEASHMVIDDGKPDEGFPIRAIAAMAVAALIAVVGRHAPRLPVRLPLRGRREDGPGPGAVRRGPAGEGRRCHVRGDLPRKEEAPGAGIANPRQRAGAPPTRNGGPATL
ncbi:MAG: hypothetical protein IKR86_02700 [Candidatus Methanomethylophilaceae archaeon]|nr:hypothetical protein [Candidatus Methanomethylophilaceae archaeon]